MTVALIGSRIFLPTCGSFEVAIWCRNFASAAATTLASSLRPESCLGMCEVMNEFDIIA